MVSSPQAGLCGDWVGVRHGLISLGCGYAKFLVEAGSCTLLPAGSVRPRAVYASDIACRTAASLLTIVA
jgi:hypothetical protein